MDPTLAPITNAILKGLVKFLEAFPVYAYKAYAPIDIPDTDLHVAPDVQVTIPVTFSVTAAGDYAAVIYRVSDGVEIGRSQRVNGVNPYVSTDVTITVTLAANTNYVIKIITYTPAIVIDCTGVAVTTRPIGG